MHKVLAFLILTGGLAFLLSENAPSPAQREAQVAAITRIVARASILEPEVVPAEQPGLRQPVASPITGHSMPVPATVPNWGPPDTGAASSRTALAVDPIKPALMSPPGTVQSAQGDKPPPQSSETVQRRLAREIQAELKRVGCYSGRLDGSWGERSRAAMQTFIEHVNASLPTHEPDVFLLSLIKGQTQSVCGPICAPGETVSAGRCVTGYEVAEVKRADRKPVQVAEAASEAVVPPHPEPLPGRMSIGGPAGNEALTAASEAPVAAGRPQAPAATDAAAEARLPWAEPATVARPVPLRLSALPREEPGSARVFERPVPIARKTTRVKGNWVASRPKPVKRRYSTSRSVQNLFLHPLGRM